MDPILGIDISKDEFHVALIPAEWPDGGKPKKPKQGRFDNTQAGFERLQAWLKRQGAPRVWACLEATSTYGDALAECLWDAGHAVSMVNPRLVRHYAKCELQRSKNDQLDAGVIARFCRSQRPHLWTPPAPELRQLRALNRRLQDLDRDCTREKNRLSVPGLDETVRASIEEHLAHLQQQMVDVHSRVEALLEQHESLRRRCELLDTIPGFGEDTAVAVVAELADIARFETSRQAAAYAGVIPAERKSGKYKGQTRMSKCGNAALRKALYFPAVTAATVGPAPAFGTFYQRLLAKGKTKLAAIGAVMHKLLRIAAAILRSGKPFDPHHRPAAVQ